MKKLLSTALFLSVCALVAPASAHAAQANLVFVRASRIANPWGGFPGMPGGGVVGGDPTCQFLKGLMKSGQGELTLEADPSRHEKKLKARVQQVFQSDFMQQIVDRIVKVRQLAYPGIGDQDSRTILTLVHDCSWDELGSGPAVLPLKSAKHGQVMYNGKPVQWVLLLGNAGWGKIDGFFNNRNEKYGVPDDVLAHELTHGMTADLLSAATIDASDKLKTSKGHDVNEISDVSTAYWEGLAEGVEATVGERLTGAFSYPFSMDPGVYGFLLERQEPVRDNHFAFDAGGLPKRGADLMSSEGFIATMTYQILSRLPYKLADGSVIEGWPFMELAKLMHDKQPKDTTEFLADVMAHGDEGLAATRYFLQATGFVTFDADAFAQYQNLKYAEREVETLTWKVQESPDDANLVKSLAAARATLASEQADWSAKVQSWLKEALGPDRANPLRAL